MKRKIFIIEEYDLKKQADVQKMIADIVKEGEINLLLRLQFYHTKLTAGILDSIADTVKAVGKEQEFVVDLVLETDQWKNVKHLRKKLNQYSIRVELMVTESVNVKDIIRYKNKLVLEKLYVPCKDYQEFQQAYDKWKISELSIGSADYELTTKEYLDFFERWIHDAKATWFEPFEDIICSMMTGVPVSACEHNSCMGKYIYLDQKGFVYFCAKKLGNTQMYSVADRKPNLLYNEVYDNTLHVAIEKRKQCMESCEMFGLCRGGCPLEGKIQKNCMEYVQKVARIGEFIEKEIGNAFSEIENPCMRQLYLSLIAYGFSATQSEE